MNSSNIMDLIGEIEEIFPVHQWTINDLHVWPLIRIKLSFDLVYAYQSNSTANTDVTPLLRAARRAAALGVGLAKYSYAYWFDYEHNDWPAKKVDAALLSDGISYTCIQGAWQEKLLQPVMNQLCREGLSCFVMSPLHEYLTPRYNPSMFIQPAIDLITIKSICGSVISNHACEKLVGFEDFLELWRTKTLPVRAITLGQVRRRAARVKALSNFYAGILTRVTPTLAFVSSYYSVEGMAFNLACRKHQIPVVDIQHGVQGELHFAYGRWKRVPDKGYELLPSLFWCWNECDALTISQWNAKVSSWHKPIVGGNPWLALWKRGSHDFIDYYDTQVMEVRQSTRKPVHVLVTLQFGLSDDKMDPIFLAMTKSRPSWHWWVRLHPCMLNKRSKVNQKLHALGIKDYEIDAATDLPLCAILGYMDIHITHSSSVVIEAESFGIPSVLTSEYGVELYPDQVRSGWAVPALSADEIIKAIEVQLKRKQSLRQVEPGLPFDENEAMTVVLDLLKANKKPQPVYEEVARGASLRT